MNLNPPAENLVQNSMLKQFITALNDPKLVLEAESPFSIRVVTIRYAAFFVTKIYYFSPSTRHKIHAAPPKLAWHLSGKSFELRHANDSSKSGFPLGQSTQI